MEKIYSKVEKDKLLHIINRFDEIYNRTNVVPEEHFIQCSTLKMEKGKTFPPHKHIFKDRHYPNQIAQESWIVIKGSVKCILYDINDEVIASPILYPGDASFTLYGGHTYEILEEDTIVYEYKTGPYEGQSLDKIFIKN
jgi:cupin fold WbuC family metalloprotein